MPQLDDIPAKSRLNMQLADRSIPLLEVELENANELIAVGTAYNFLVNTPQWKTVMEGAVFDKLVQKNIDYLISDSTKADATNILTGIAVIRSHLKSMENLLEQATQNKLETEEALRNMRSFAGGNV